MKKNGAFKRLGMLLLVSLLLNSVVPMLTCVAVAIAMFDVNPRFSGSLLLNMGIRIAQLSLVAAIIIGLMMIGGRRFCAWASLPVCTLPYALGLPDIRLCTKSLDTR